MINLTDVAGSTSDGAVTDTAADDLSTTTGPTPAPLGYTLSDVAGPLDPDQLRLIDAWWRAATTCPSARST